MLRKKRALLVGSSFSAAPIFFALKKYGLDVAVCGNLNSDPCHEYADDSFYLDYSHWDELARLVASERFDYIVPTCNDYSYMSCAHVAESMGFPGFDRFEVAQVLHCKDKFRSAIEHYSVPSPKFQRSESIDGVDTAGMKFPVLVKPTDSFSGRGVTKVLSELDLAAAVDKALANSRSSEVVIEEFVEGTLHSHSAFVRDGKVALDFFVDEFCTVYPYQVDCSNHPSSTPGSVQDKVRKAINELVIQLELNDGLLHTQFITSGEAVWIIECMRRCPGDLYGHLIQKSTGIDYADLFVRPFLGKPLPSLSEVIAPKFVGRHTVSVRHPVVYFAFSYAIPGSSIDIVALKGSGETLEAAPFDKLGIVFVEFGSRDAMFEQTPRLAEFGEIQTLGGRVNGRE